MGEVGLEGRSEKQLTFLAFSALKSAHIAYTENKILNKITSQGSSEIPSVPCLSCNDYSPIPLTGHLLTP